MIRVSCPNCKTILEAADLHADHVISCSSCNTSLAVAPNPGCGKNATDALLDEMETISKQKTILDAKLKSKTPGTALKELEKLMEKAVTEDSPLVLPPEPPPLPPEPPPLPPEPPPLPPETTGLGNLASGWFNVAKNAMAKAQEKTLEIAQGALNKAKEAAAKAGPPQNSEPPKQVTPKEFPTLATRKITPITKTGFFLPDDFAKCWNQIEDAGVNIGELEFYGATATKVEGSLINKLMGFFSAEKKAPPYYNLAISKNNLFIVHSDPEEKVTSKNYSFDELDWTLTFKSDQENTGWFSSANKNEAPAPYFLLNLKKADQIHELKLFDCPEIKSIATLISDKMLKLANQYFVTGDYDSCEKFILKIPVDNVHYACGKELTDKIGFVAKAKVIYQSGHQDYGNPVGGILRYDSRGLSFYPTSDVEPFVCPPIKLRKIFEPKAGKFPPEYIEEIKSKKKSAQSAVRRAKLGLKSSNANVRVLAQTSLRMAVSRLNRIKIGPPFLNRVGIVSSSGGELRKFVFDFSGITKSEVDASAASFFQALSQVSEKWGKKSASPKVAVVAKPILSLEAKPRIVGCPKCKAKIRTMKVGVIGCPKCKTRVRVN